ncbi:hypothetical protein ABIA95_002244 [Bradyrhizobium sp. LA8.1]
MAGVSKDGRMRSPTPFSTHQVASDSRPGRKDPG